MMRMGIRVSSYQVIHDKRNLRKALRAMGNLVARRARSLIRGNKTSRPGGPPVSRTGALARSIRVKVGRGGLSVSVRDTQFYALFLENGAKGGGGRRGAGRDRRGKPGTSRVLEARPFLSAALENSQAIIRERMQAAAANSIKGTDG